MLYTKNNVAPAAAVASGRTAQRNVLFPAKSDTAVAALTGSNFYESFVGKPDH